MGNFLKAVPLPLRIVALLLIVLALSSVLGRAPSSVFVTIAVALWLLVLTAWAYDQGWLNFLARAPGVSHLLGRLTSRAAISGGFGSAAASPAPSAPPGELSSEDRFKLRAAAEKRLGELTGLDEGARGEIDRLLRQAEANPENPFSSNAPATILFVAGPSGVGKTSLAQILAGLLTGAGAVKTAKIVKISQLDAQESGPQNLAELARTQVRAARGGVLLLDDADWLLTPDSYGDQTPPGVRFGAALLKALEEARREVLVVATLRESSLNGLTNDAAHAAWLGKLTQRKILLADFDEVALLDVLESELAAMDWRLEDDKAETAAQRLLSDLSRRKGGAEFDNAFACRRLAETLVEISSRGGEFEDLGRRRLIGRAAIRAADE